LEDGGSDLVVSNNHAWICSEYREGKKNQENRQAENDTEELFHRNTTLLIVSVLVSLDFLITIMDVLKGNH
jgi:hypothetical protein